MVLVQVVEMEKEFKMLTQRMEALVNAEKEQGAKLGRVHNRLHVESQAGQEDFIGERKHGRRDLELAIKLAEAEMPRLKNSDAEQRNLQRKLKEETERVKKGALTEQQWNAAWNKESVDEKGAVWEACAPGERRTQQQAFALAALKAGRALQEGRDTLANIRQRHSDDPMERKEVKNAGDGAVQTAETVVSDVTLERKMRSDRLSQEEAKFDKLQREADKQQEAVEETIAVLTQRLKELGDAKKVQSSQAERLAKCKYLDDKLAKEDQDTLELAEKLRAIGQATVSERERLKQETEGGKRAFTEEVSAVAKDLQVKECYLSSLSSMAITGALHRTYEELEEKVRAKQQAREQFEVEKANLQRDLEMDPLNTDLEHCLVQLEDANDVSETAVKREVEELETECCELEKVKERRTSLFVRKNNPCAKPDSRFAYTHEAEMKDMTKSAKEWSDSFDVAFLSYRPSEAIKRQVQEKMRVEELSREVERMREQQKQNQIQIQKAWLVALQKTILSRSFVPQLFLIWKRRVFTKCSRLSDSNTS